MSPSVDVVIPVLNRYELTTNCLALLRGQTIPHRVIVVDDGSRDETPARLRTDWPDVSCVSLEANRGFSAACNSGAREGSGEIIVLLNNDVECPPDFLEKLVSPLLDPAVGSVASLMLRPGGERIDSVGLAADPTLAGFPRHQGERCERAREGFPTLTGPAGAAAAYRRSAWEEVGGLDEAIFAYMEDLDLALRMRLAGWRAAVALDAVATHLGAATHGHRSASQRYHGGFARGYLLRRYGLLRSRAAARVVATEAIVILGDLVISGDRHALRGRLAGWRAAGSRPRLPRPPADVLESGIGLRRSLALRRSAYGGGPPVASVPPALA